MLADQTLNPYCEFPVFKILEDKQVDHTKETLDSSNWYEAYEKSKGDRARYKREANNRSGFDVAK